MNETELDEVIAKVREISDRRYSRLRIELGSPASEADIGAVENFLGVKLAPSHSSFLRLHNGILISLFDRESIRFNDPSYPGTRLLSVFSTQEIPDWTLYFRGYFDAAYCDDMPYLSPASAARFAEIASVTGEDSRIVAFLHERSSDGEYPIREVRVDQFEWLQHDDDKTTQWFLARSFEEFVRRSLAYVIASDGAGFDYWQPNVRG